MIDIAFATAQRLRAQAGAVLRLVGTVADFESLAGMPRSLPAAYVLPLAETAEEVRQLGPTLQLHRCTLAVLLFARHAGDASGMQSAGALHEMRAAVHAALIGWMADEAAPEDCLPMVFTAGELLQADTGTTVWRDEFEVSRYVRQAQ